MRKPLALSAHLALRQTASERPATPPPPRPKGPLVWVHCEDLQRLPIVAALAALLTEDGDQVAVLATTGEAMRAGPVMTQPIPEDSIPAARQFLDHWQPDVLVWLEGALQPALISEAADRGIPRLVLDVTESHPDVPPRARVPGLARAVLGLFEQAVCADPRGAARLGRAGLPKSAIHAAEPFDPGPQVHPCNEAERADLATAFASRPVWLAAGAVTAELPQLLTAYRLASQRRHQLVLILASEDPEAAAEALAGQPYSVCDYLAGDLPRDSTQIILADMETLGLWYRLAPLTYIGGTLRGGQVLDPFDAAALGSVVIHGLKTTRYRHRFEQLADASACRMVQSETELGRIVEALLSPDRAAQMAHAAWDVISRGAETGTLVVDIVRAALDRAGR